MCVKVLKNMMKKRKKKKKRDESSALDSQGFIIYQFVKLGWKMIKTKKRKE
jgi:hypothetical protein